MFSRDNWESLTLLLGPGGLGSRGGGSYNTRPGRTGFVVRPSRPMVVGTDPELIGIGLAEIRRAGKATGDADIQY